MKKFIKEIYPYIIVLIVVLLVKTYVMSPIQVNGDSMYATLKSGDIMLLNKLEYKFSEIERFDIVVINYDNKHLIKRVIGLPGETIEIKDGNLYINDILTEEYYLDPSTITKDFKLEGKIPEGYYFVMGDNREISLDSRALGVFSKNKIEGKAFFTLLPFDRFGSKK